MTYATNPDAGFPFPLVAPVNDNLCNAIPLTLGAPCAGYTYTTIDATLEPNEPNPTCFIVEKTVWFSFTAPVTGIVLITSTHADPGLWMVRGLYVLAGGPPNCNNHTNLYQLTCSSDQYGPSLWYCGLAPGETYYIQIATVPAPFQDDFCIEIVGEVTANAGPDQVLCNMTSTTLAGNTPIVDDGQWAVISGTATITDINSPTSGVTGLVPGTSVTLEWNTGFCPETFINEEPLTLMNYVSSDQMTITVDALPTTANAGFDRLTCDTLTNAIGNAPIVGTGLWTVVSGTATLATPTLPSTNVTDLVYGSVVTLQWTITNGTCPPSTDQMTISTLTDPNAGPDQQLCTNVNSTTLAANPVTVGLGFWSVISGMATITDNLSPTTSVTLTPGVPTALEWFIFFPPEGCDRRDTMMITWADPPSVALAGPDQVMCNQTTATLAANTPMVGTGLWTVVSGTAMVTNPSSPTSEVTGLVPGTSAVLQWTITNEPCSSSSDQMTITTGEVTIADAGPDQDLCYGFDNTTNLEGNTPIIGTGLWTLILGSATISDPTSPTTSVTVTPGFIALLRWTITNGACSSYDEVIIYSNSVIVTAGPDQVLCNLTTTQLAGNIPPPIVGEGTWTVLSGSATITDPSLYNTTVTNLIPGTTVTLQWEIFDNASECFAYDEMTITVDAPVTPANAGPDQILCDLSTTTLAANTPMTGTGIWTVFPGSTATITDPSSPTSGVTGLLPPFSAASLSWTITNGACISTDFMNVIVRAIPIAFAGSDQQLCNTTTTTLNATPPLCFGEGVCETGLWTLISGTANITDPTSPVSEVTGLIIGSSATLQWTVSGPGGYCSASDQVTITVDALPTIADAGPWQNLCEQYSTTLAGNVPVIGTGLWTLYGLGTLADPTSPTSGITDLLPDTQVVLVWTISNGICPSSDDFVVLFTETSPVTNAGMDQQLCNVTTTELSADPLLCGDYGGYYVCETGLWTVISGTANITDPSSPFSEVTDLIPGTSVTLQWTIFGLSGNCSASDQMTITVDALPTTSNAGPDQQLCNQTTTTLAANTPVVGSGQWSVISGIANLTNPYSPTSGVNSLVPGASAVLQWNIANGNCPPSADQMTITVYALPTTSNAGPDQQLCNQTTTTLAANIPAIGAGSWTLISGTATITTPGSPTSGVTGLVPGTSAVLQWNIANGSCPPSADQMTITVYALPTTSNAGPDQQLCNQTTTTLAANTPVIGSGQWSVISGTANITNPTSPMSGVTGLLADASVVLQWTISNGTCPSTTDQMTITNFALPTPANAGSDKELCDQTTTTLSGNNPTVGIGMWSVINGTANITNPSSPVSGVTGLIPGTTTTLQWSISNGACPASTDQMTITVYALPTTANAGPDQQLCNQTTTTLAANNPSVGSGQWTVISGTANITNPSSPVSGVTGLMPGISTTLQWEITNGTCPPSADLVKIKVDELPSPAEAGPDKFLCDQSATVVNALEPLIGSGMWSVISGTATIIPPDQHLAAVLNLVNETTATLQWAVSNGTCPASTDQISITVSEAPTEADAGPDQLVCYSTITHLQGNTPDVGVGYWLKLSGPGEITAPESPTSEITGLQSGIPTIVQWTIRNGYCQPSSDEVMLEITDDVVSADAGPDQLICGETSVALTGNDPGMGNGFWTIVQGSATIADPNNPTTTISDLIPGKTIVLEWTITSGSCPPSNDQVSIFVDQSAGFADAGPDQVLCQQLTTMVEGNIPNGGSGQWTVISGSADVFPTDQPVAQVMNLLPGTAVILQWTVSNGVCPPDSDQIAIIIETEPSIALAGVDQALCNETSALVSANTPLSGAGNWSVVLGQANIQDPSSPSTAISGLIPGTSTVLQWEITSAGCPPSNDQLLIQIDELPTTSDAGTDQMLCDNTNTSLQANTPLIGQGSWTVLNGSASLTDPSSSTSPVTDLQPGQSVTLQWTVSNGVCPESNDLMTIQADHLPSIADAGADQVICGDIPALIQATVPVYGQGQWSVINGTATLADPLSPATMVTNLVPGNTVTLQWTVSNGTCPQTTDELIIEIKEAPTEADAGVDQSLCEQTQSLLNANIPTVGTGQWEIISGTGMLSDPSQPNSGVTGLTSGVPFILQWVTTYESCQSKDTITIISYDAPNVANAGEDQTICTTETIMNGNTPVMGTGTWTILSGTGILSDVSNPVSAITGLIPGASVVLQWSIVNGECPETHDEVTILVDAEAPMATAGDDQQLCGATITTMQALPPNIGTGTWTVISGTATIEDSLSESTTVSGLVPGSTTVLRWTVSGNACPSAHDDVVITIDALLMPSDAGPDEIICSTEHMLSAEDPAVGTGVWSIISGIGNLQDQFDPSTLLSDVPEGTAVSLEWKITSGICPSVADTVTITSVPNPDIPMAGDDQVLCNSSHSILMANQPDPGKGIGAWSLISGAGEIENINESITNVTELALGANLFAWTISNGACAPASDTVVILNNDGAELKSNFLVSEFACTDDSVHIFDISGNATLPNGFFWDFGDNTTSTERDPIHVYTQQGDYTITFTTVLDGCGTASTSKVIRVFNCATNPSGNGGTRKVMYANVFPNPSDEDFQVNIKLRAESEVKITLCDAVGRITETRRITDEKDINAIFEVEVPGLYFFQIQVGLEILIFKVVKVETTR